MLKRIVIHREPIDSSVFVNPLTQELFYDPFSLIDLDFEDGELNDNEF
jgi:hypothetical protein